jgi:anti-sigma-K factor RskA
MTAHDQFRENLHFYAVGALPQDESQQLERHLSECAECREELSLLNDAAAQIALAVEPTPPPSRLRERLTTQMQGEHSIAPSRVDRLHSVDLSHSRRIWFWAPAFAVAALAFAFVLVWNRDREIQRENRELAAKLQANSQAVQQARELIDMLSASDAQRVTLVATGERPKPEARAVYSSQKRSLLLLASNLNPLPAKKLYELWLLPSNGTKPVPVGTFKPDTSGSATLVLAQFADAVSAKGFAVTIENEPGSATPTLPIILSGTS